MCENEFNRQSTKRDMGMNIKLDEAAIHLPDVLKAAMGNGDQN